ncbi:hypothetical protein ACIA5D_47095 [Actinoplanes sp. NPDC051513]|uniref:hypothetical protein n=1 Tax=Actinoplanes sp. NPDC051513 TaxID=3363908 RepID=UPI0037BCAC68
MIEPTSDQIESFLAAFFGPGNSVPLTENPTSPLGQWLAPFLQAARRPSDVPVVLPRRTPTQPDRRLAYVIAWDQAHATLVAELLTAFVGPTYSYFNGLPAALDSDDPVERAIIDLVGLDTTFVLRSPTTEHESGAWRALRQMQRTLDQRPVRNWQIPKPVGRLLGEFEVALGAGDNTASATVLEQLAATGGLGGANLNNLRIKRLARLGRDIDLLGLPSLADVVAADPPTPVRDAIFAALYNHSVATALDDHDYDTARSRLIADGTAVPADLRPGLTELSTDALWVVLLAADLRNDQAVLSELLGDPDLRRRLDRYPDLVASIEQGRPRSAAPAPTTAGARPVIASWVELALAHAAAEPAAIAALRQETWREWPKPHTVDQELATAIAALDYVQGERIWQLLGPFLDADEYGLPARRTATEFLQLALVHNWFSPADLAGIVALTETILRSSPDRATYASLLDDLASEADRWISPDRSLVVLDVADLLVRMPCPDNEARLQLGIRLLTPLASHAGRLDDEVRRFAQQLDDELGTDLTWPQPVDDDQRLSGPKLADLPALKVMLYSLDEAALNRTRTVLSRLVPRLNIHTTSDHVGSPQLKQHSQRSDIVILATRCATHAATGFIRAHLAPDAIIDEADGCGSASLLRAATAALQTWLLLHPS